MGEYTQRRLSSLARANERAISWKPIVAKVLSDLDRWKGFSSCWPLQVLVNDLSNYAPAWVIKELRQRAPIMRGHMFDPADDGARNAIFHKLLFSWGELAIDIYETRFPQDSRPRQILANLKTSHWYEGWRVAEQVVSDCSASDYFDALEAALTISSASVSLSSVCVIGVTARYLQRACLSSKLAEAECRAFKAITALNVAVPEMNFILGHIRDPGDYAPLPHARLDERAVVWEAALSALDEAISTGMTASKTNR